MGGHATPIVYCCTLGGVGSTHDFSTGFPTQRPTSRGKGQMTPPEESYTIAPSARLRHLTPVHTLPSSPFHYDSEILLHPPQSLFLGALKLAFVAGVDIVKECNGHYDGAVLAWL